ncbi:class I SAM-dependent methyltransferase [Aliidiomarina sp. Khilg15.8]
MILIKHAVPLLAAEPELEPAAAKRALALGLPADDNGADFVLELTREGLQLRWRGTGKMSPLLPDFSRGTQAWRRQAGGMRQEAIVRALGVARGHRPHILDATAGLGRDAMILAYAGCPVQMLERHPAIHALLQDAVERAANCSDLGHWVSERVSVLPRGSLFEAEQLQALSEQPPMAIYLDPMFPHRDKSAAVKKDMQMLQQLVGSDPDADELLPAALALATHRVVVKRPAKAPVLRGQEPSSQVQSKKHRFDIYIKQAY